MGEVVRQYPSRPCGTIRGHRVAPRRANARGRGHHLMRGSRMDDCTTPPSRPSIRVNLLRAHGSPSRYHYVKGCRCAACRGQKAAYNVSYYAAHLEQSAQRSARRRAGNAAYRAAHPEKAADKLRCLKYDLLPGEWAARFAAQGNVCAICGTAEPGGNGHWHTDHDHDAGKVRGILCHNHNVGLGYFRDNPAHLMAAIEYLAAATP